jgi:hypothetical protein
MPRFNDFVIFCNLKFSFDRVFTPWRGVRRGGVHNPDWGLPRRNGDNAGFA